MYFLISNDNDFQPGDTPPTEPQEPADHFQVVKNLEG
jgi:hypothetical protein